MLVKYKVLLKEKQRTNLQFYVFIYFVLSSNYACGRGIAMNIHKRTKHSAFQAHMSFGDPPKRRFYSLPLSF
jgi:hypothetical protein